MGADRTINVANAPEELSSYSSNKGLKPRATLVQLGLGGDVSIPQNMVVAKEIEIRGTFRFHEEFGVAVDLINDRRVDLKALLSGIYPLVDAIQAFEAAGDRSESMKVQLAF